MTAAPWPRPADESDRQVALELYKGSVEEYRWQAVYNWSRTQWLLGFPAALLAAGTALGDKPAAALVFALGAVAAALGALAVGTMHAYYRTARDRMRQLEDDLGVDVRHRTNTTTTLGGRRRAAR